MKNIFYLILAIVIFVLAYHQAVQIKGFAKWVQETRVSLERSGSGRNRPHQIKKGSDANFFRIPAPSKQEKPSNAVTLYLKNGSQVSGEFLWEDDKKVMVRWQGGEVEFKREEVERIQKGEFEQEKEGMLFPGLPPEAWSYQNDVVVVLTNGTTLDSKIVSADGSRMTLRKELTEGGAIEQEVDRSQLERLSFKPVDNERGRAIEETLRTQFPKMKWYREGPFFLLTDSYATWVNEYRKTIRELAVDFYLTYLPLLKGREPLLPHFVVIFDDWSDYIEYAVTDGVPGWVVPGYFSPDHEVLYLVNMLGDNFSHLIEEAIVGRTGRAMDQAVDAVEKQVDKRYHVFVEGQAHDVMKKFSAYHSIVRGYYRDLTVMVLRHEMTHEFFHNFGLQTIVVSKLKGDQKAEAEKKRAFLKEEDIQKKRELLLELVNLRGDRKQSMQLDAANSWFVEGLATYMEASPPGSENKLRLYDFQEAKRKKALLPIEFLTVYKMGSFPGISGEAMLYAYAESWAFVHFLMHRYPEGFLKYLERVSREKPKENEDIQWLLSAVGKELRPLENEFLEYMDQFPKLEDPYLEQLDTMRSVFQR